MVRRISADTAMLVGCALSWGVAIAAVLGVDSASDVHLFAWSPWDWMPLGAFACGVVAGAGGFIGLALSRMRPTPLGVALPALAGLSIPVSFHALLWYFGPLGGGPTPRETIALWAYLGEAFSDPVFHSSPGVVALQIIGAFLGGAVSSAVVLWVDACPRCSELMSDAGRIDRFVDDASQLTRLSQASLDEPGYVSMLSALEKRSTGLIRITACLKLCKHCGMGEVVESRRQRSANGWGRPSRRRKYGARAPAMVRWFMPPVNGAQDAGSGGVAARAGGAPSP